MWIEELTSEQQALIYACREKWIKIAFSTEPIHRPKATEVAKRLYNLIGLKKPDIQFARSPYEALEMCIDPIELPPPEQSSSRSQEYLIGQFKKVHGEPLYWEFRNKLWQTLYHCVQKQVKDDLFSQIDEELEDKRLGEMFVGIFKYEPMHFLFQQLCRDLVARMKQKSSFLKILPEFFVWREYLIEATRCLDFCISVLHCDIDGELWEVFKSLLTECGWIFPWEETCFICDRPIEISFGGYIRRERKLELAVKFSDGYGF